MDLPTLMIYIAFYWKVLEPAKSISNTYAMIQRGLVSGERIFAILDEPVAIKKADNPARIDTFKKSLVFRRGIVLNTTTSRYLRISHSL